MKIEQVNNMTITRNLNENTFIFQVLDSMITDLPQQISSTRLELLRGKGRTQVVVR